MTTADTQTVVTPTDSRNGEAGRLCVQRLVTPPTPYHSENGITIYCGDCRDIAPLIDATVLIADPPYGINVGNNQSAKEKRAGLLVKKSYATYQDTPENYREVVVPVITELLARVKRGGVFGFPPNIWLLPPPDALGGVYVPAGCGRSKWGFTGFMPVCLYGTAPNLQNGARPTCLRSTDVAQESEHPTPKPEQWLNWLVSLASEQSDTILDPFMGSGTTLVAAKLQGRKAVGIEINEQYCAEAVRRLAQGVLLAV